jgi:hypothetical protein
VSPYTNHGVNHNIEDVALFVKHMVAAWHFQPSGFIRVNHAAADYEMEMRVRTGPATDASWQACRDAHDYTALTPYSPLFSSA